MPIISPLLNAFLFWGNILQELSARTEEAQAVTVFKWLWLERIRLAFWAWMEATFVAFWFDGPDHTEHALRDTRWRTYELSWQLVLRIPGPLLHGWILYKILT